MRIDSGTNVIASERWLDEIRRGRAFFRGGFLGASVGNFSEIQLFNPATSALNAIVWHAVISASGLGDMDVRSFNTALATLVGTGFNLQAGGATSQAEVRTAQPVARDGTLMALVRVAANIEVPVGQLFFYEIGPGEGILMTPSGTNGDIYVRQYWIELPT